MLARVELSETRLECPATPVVQSMDRALGFFERGSNLNRGQASDMPENKNLPLILGELLEGGTQVPSPIRARAKCCPPTIH